MIRLQPQEFIVEEITPEGEILEIDKQIKKTGEKLKSNSFFFSQFVLQKKLWTTSNAIRHIADRLHISANRINFAGNKDRNAITVQRCSAFAVEPQRILALHIKDLQVNGAWLTNEKVKLGSLSGNRFTIILNEGNVGKTTFGKFSAQKVQKKLKANNYAFPNYFGSQRFGSSRRNTAEVGKLIIQGRFKDAMLNYLCFTDENEHDERASNARKRLQQEMNYREALHYFPHYLSHERRLLAHLVHSPNDFLGAYRKLHRSLQLLFVHAYQSALFNLILQNRIKKKRLMRAEIGDFYSEIDEQGFPSTEKPIKIESKDQLKTAQETIDSQKAVLLGNIMGYASELTLEENSVLEKEGLSREHFLMRSTPELSSKGTFRPLFVFLKDFSIEGKEGQIVLKFILPSGSYATVALEQIIT